MHCLKGWAPSHPGISVPTPASSHFCSFFPRGQIPVLHEGGSGLVSLLGYAESEWWEKCRVGVGLGPEAELPHTAAVGHVLPVPGSARHRLFSPCRLHPPLVAGQAEQARPQHSRRG